MNLVKKILNRLLERTHAKKFYGQLAEDIIILNILSWLKIEKPYYLDIGASHPIKINNTYILYENNFSGILVDANPKLIELSQKVRPRDKSINVGIGKNEGVLDFYIMENETLSTFDKQIANNYNIPIKNIISVIVISINKLLEEYCNKTPNFINIDIEGLQLEIIESFDFSRFRPEVFCIETQDEEHKKIKEIFDIMHSNNYITIADTYINTIL
jgi:FkbM family methyltransferase